MATAFAPMRVRFPSNPSMPSLWMYSGRTVIPSSFSPAMRQVYTSLPSEADRKAEGTWCVRAGFAAGGLLRAQLAQPLANC